MRGIQLFPEIEEVFIDNINQCKEHFYPLATIDLSIVDSNLQGSIHVVYSNNDPYCDESEAHSNDYCNNEYMIFDIIDNKLKFKGDFGFFKTNEDWIEWLEKGKKSYLLEKAKYKAGNLKAEGVIKNIGEIPDWLQEENWPRDEKGNKLVFICQIWSGDFVSDYCDEEIYVFYEPIDNQTMQIHQID